MTSPIKSKKKLNFQWDTLDPFLFCVHHKDDFPEGTESMGVDPSEKRGRNIGSDFQLKNGFRMYHGENVPGFPAHPHRGFETVTVVLDGFVDHSDSFGTSGRYGNGDVQWMTAGRGMQHCEMFPLINQDKRNTMELFQIWLNLPAKDKMVDPHYKMLWAEDIPIIEEADEEGRISKIRIIAGRIKDTVADECAPHSWAHDEENHVSIFIIDMEANAKWPLPLGEPDVNRVLYYFEGESKVTIADQQFSKQTGITLYPERECIIEMGDAPGRFLLLEGKPINEPVVQRGPFVMNTPEEIMQTFMEYQVTQFGGWPWDRSDPVHDRSRGRFATYASGEEEYRD
eukprot:TRINITY_DN2036_c0_g1_i1.p1 TRINITY_DN2036_c0_g1~~TRINITY_DN2036_c0_g1_i1.p1  ORF type:complete len:354 (+),score=92.55 TRINITY_DN2036_c0_g1_i1:41-1063(+)